MQATQNTDRPRALLVSVRTPKMTETEAEESLAELSRLVGTLGYHVIGTQSQRQPSTTGLTVVGEGKLKELARWTGGKGVAKRGPKRNDDSEDSSDLPLDAVAPNELATVVVFDCDLTPSQLRNVENALEVDVLDRTGVIIEIFSRHAKTRAARLQVEIARLNYLSPRLREVGGGDKERQSGRGSGETALELDRRKVRDRLAELRRELDNVQQEQGNRRSQRSEHMCVALVGYTNAGKSSTMRALTGSDVLVEDKLFATLDTTVRAMQPETQPRILVSDTVGFIKKLPHDLVASFRSTLEEARHASLLLYVVDASDPTFRAQLAVVNDVLREVGVENTPHIHLLNKSDRLTDDEKEALQKEFPDALLISSREPKDIQFLREQIMQFAERDMCEEEIFVPYTAQGVIGEIRSNMRIIHESYDGDGIRIRVRSKTQDLARVTKMLQ